MDNSLNLLSSRAGFNTALHHFKTVTSYISDVEEGKNLADIINTSIEEQLLQRFQIRAIVNALLVDKFNYMFKSHNIENEVKDPEGIVEEISKWGNIQLILSYFHPHTGLSVINPKKTIAWENIIPLAKDELIVVYTGPSKDEIANTTLKSAISDFISLLYGKKIKTKNEYLGKIVEKKLEAIPTQAPKRRATPRYSVQVTNELFHNGNVEAWKKIIESYKTNYNDLDVLIWYENERINNINALFKWGKVKHGGIIFFSVVGDNIKDVSKLKRYLFEGASPRFEAFLKGGIGRTLDLF